MIKETFISKFNFELYQNPLGLV